MLFGFLSAVVSGFADLKKEVAGQRADLRALQAEVRNMVKAEDQVRDDLARITSQVATMAASYIAANASRIDAAVAKAKVEWQAAADADKEAVFTGLHAELSAISSTMAAGQPVTPAPTADNPSPAPVAAPATDGSAPAASPAGSAI